MLCSTNSRSDLYRVYTSTVPFILKPPHWLTLLYKRLKTSRYRKPWKISMFSNEVLTFNLNRLNFLLVFMMAEVKNSGRFSQTYFIYIFGSSVYYAVRRGFYDDRSYKVDATVQECIIESNLARLICWLVLNEWTRIRYIFYSWPGYRSLKNGRQLEISVR